MKQRKISTNVLRLFLCVIAFMIFAVCIFVVPWLGRVADIYFSLVSVIFIVSCFYASSIPFFYAVYQAWKLLNYIDRKQAFALPAVIALQHIQWCAFGVSGLHALVLPFIYWIADIDDAPGLIIIGMVIPGAAFIIGVFAAVLRKLFHEALLIQQDNELTI